MKIEAVSDSHHTSVYARLSGREREEDWRLDRRWKRWEPERMSRAAANLIAALDELPANDREEVVSEFVRRRVAQSDHGAPSDDELTAAADQVFQALDRAETSGR